MCGPSLTRDAVLDALREIEDPEVATSIVDLGLIYDISISEDGFVIVEMTTTTRFCPASGFLTEAVKIRLEALEQVSKAQVRLVYDPPWSPDMAQLFSF
ncbi:putative metal-sulfur cluster biosynthetic enzyme [Rhizobium sp. CF122]|uniref:metal-sulfur cluster assembly factor n=1 Tax=Rhizobium sp. CF122 TaxID=1144312 RepID=UPI0002717DC3|nr:metal-sulfur cluster assembly factor [Rhizobium sp. CF122]EJL53691.1 putative metal-sulfur cluster biosynthetic enzyme [Rhizobium sp. CF122]